VRADEPSSLRGLLLRDHPIGWRSETLRREKLTHPPQRIELVVGDASRSDHQAEVNPALGSGRQGDGHR